MKNKILSLYTRFPEVFATLFLFVLTLPFHFPYQADDYAFIHGSMLPGGFNLFGYDVQMTRNPLLYVMVVPLFASGLFEYGFFPLYLFFLTYALGVGLAVRGLFRDCGLKTSPALLTSALAVLPLLVLNPNQAEVFYFAICMPYSTGALMLGLMAYSRSPIVRVLAMVLAFATLETFIFPALLLLILPSILKFSNSEIRFEWPRSEVMKPVLLWGVAIALTLINRKVMTLFFPQYSYNFVLDPSGVLRQFNEIIGMMTMSFFYKTNYITTLLELGGIIWLIVLLVKRSILQYRTLAIILFILFLGELHVLIMSYSAMRAHFGAIFLRTLFLIFFFALLFRSSVQRWQKVACVSLVLLSYVIQNIYIFTIKDNNYHALQKTNVELILRMESCVEPCLLQVSELDHGTRRDWVLPQLFWHVYLEVLRLKHQPNKNIKFEIVDVASVTSGEPTR